MKIIEVFLKDELLWELPILDKKISIGRAKSNNIILPEAYVSRKHANVIVEDEKLLLIDLSSSGTFLNGEKILSSKTIYKDDKISIGHYSLYIREVNETEKEEEAHETIKFKASSLPSFLTPKTQSFLLHQASIFILTGPNKGKEIQIKKEQFSFGRKSANDLVLNDEQVCGHHGDIYFKKGEFFVRDHGSSSGIYIDGKRIHGATLSSNTKINIGKCRIEFRIKGADILSSEKKDHLGDIIGRSKRIQEIYTVIRKAASCDATVLLSGETGTGKGLVAKTIHSISARSKNSFVTIDCGSIPRDLIESELFGHEKGAFTSANSNRIGAFEQADKGTVFLDEIGELSKEMQPKLLRILEEKEFKRVGGNKYISPDIRVITATNRELNEDVIKGKFREDLFFRLYVIPIYLPPLRERIEDISFLAEYFIKKSPHLNKRITLSDEALKKMENFSWPGNIRELSNVMERAMVNMEGSVITADEIKFAPITKSTEGKTILNGTSLQEVEKQTIINALKSQGGNKKATAKALGIAYSTICEKIKKYKIHF